MHLFLSLGDPTALQLCLSDTLTKAAPSMVPQQLALMAGAGAALGFGPSPESTCRCGQPGEPSETGFSKKLNYMLLD